MTTINRESVLQLAQDSHPKALVLHDATTVAVAETLVAEGRLERGPHDNPDGPRAYCLAGPWTRTGAGRHAVPDGSAFLADNYLGGAVEVPTVKMPAPRRIVFAVTSAIPGDVEPIETCTVDADPGDENDGGDE